MRPQRDRRLDPGASFLLPCGGLWTTVSPGGRARILIADDDPVTRELLLGLVQSLGYDPVAVPDGEAALEAVATQPPDLVLSDVAMPGLSGFHVCRRLKADPATRDRGVRDNGAGEAK